MTTTTRSNARLAAAYITQDEITALRVDAGAHGDAALVATCNRALRGNSAARRTCAKILRDAKTNAVTS